MTQSQRSQTNHLVARLGEVRTDWSLAEVRELFALPFADLLFHAQREGFGGRGQQAGLRGGRQHVNRSDRFAAPGLAWIGCLRHDGVGNVGC